MAELGSFGALLERGYVDPENEYATSDSAVSSFEEPQLLYDCDNNFFDVPAGNQNVRKIMCDNTLLEYYLNIQNENTDSKTILESVLRKILVYSGANHLYYLKNGKGDQLLLDASMTPGRTWSLLESTSIANTDLFPSEALIGCKNSLKAYYIQSKEELAEISKESEEYHAIESILCVPAVIEKRFCGCICIAHYSVRDAFKHVNSKLISLLASVLTAQLTNTSLFGRLSNLLLRSIVPCVESVTKKNLKVLIHDLVHYYDSTSSYWLEGYGVLTEETLYIFRDSNEVTHALALPMNSTNSILIAAYKQFAQQEFNIPEEFPTSKSISKHSVGYISHEEGVLWIAISKIEVAQQWNSRLRLAKASSENEKIIIPENIRINPKEVLHGKLLGQGAAAKVYKGSWHNTTVAIKELYDQFDQSEVKAFFQEMKMLQELHHPNIITLFGGFISNDAQRPSIVMEFAGKGTLSYLLYDYKDAFPVRLRLKLLVQTSKALQYLHSFEPPIIHRDLKPENILVSNDIHF